MLLKLRVRYGPTEHQKKNLLSCGNNLASCVNNLLTRGNKIETRALRERTPPSRGLNL